MRGKNNAEIDAFFTSLLQEPFYFEEPTMYRFAAVNIDSEQCGIFLCAHHIICDAWSISLLSKEIVRYYQQELSGTAVPNPMPSYLNAVTAEQNYFTSQRYENDNLYWKNVFENKPQLCRIKDIKGNRDSKAARYSYLLNASLVSEMNKFCEIENITPAVLFESALFAYLHRINEFASPVTIGIPVLNRSNITEKKTIGMFISTMPLSVPVDENASMADLCQTIRVKHMEIFRHQKYPISHILQNIRVKDADFTNLYDVMISYQNARIDGLDIDVSALWYPNGHSEVPLCVHIEDMGNTGGYKLHFDYQTAVLSDLEVTALCERLLHILRQTMDNDGSTKICDFQIVSPAEYQRVIRDFNNTTVDYPKEKCVHQLFEEQVAKNPDAVAVVFEGVEYTYSQINEMANSLSHILREKGIGRKDIVAIIAKRSHKIIVAQLAVLKAGGAYMPIDPNYPKERIDFMVSDAQCKTALVLGTSVDGIDMDDDSIFSGNTDALENINFPKDLFCALHTSGSTGVPKGTLLTHMNVVNFAYASKNVYDNVKTTLSTTTIVFDVYMQESIISLCWGIKVIYLSDQELSNQSLFEMAVEKYKDCYIFQTPTKMESYIVNSKTKNFLKHINSFVIGGEAFPKKLFDMIHRHNINNDMFNIYGPTETTVCSTTNQVSKLRVTNIYGPAETTAWSATAVIESDDIHIGRPIANTQIYILDKNLRPLPIGAVGELCISGDGVGCGYLNRPELTAEKFVPNPFIEGKRMYRTGDLARWREDGNIEYIGRMDNQVKIRGLRIELGEIEAAIIKFEGIEQIAVVERKD